MELNADRNSTRIQVCAVASPAVYHNHDDLKMMEYICGETHRDISQIKGIKEARAQNAMRAEGK